MTANKIKNRLDELASHLTFSYKGVSCGVDPLSRDHFNMWYGDSDFVADSLERVMNEPFFNGKSLAEIAEKIEIIDW